MPSLTSSLLPRLRQPTSPAQREAFVFLGLAGLLYALYYFGYERYLAPDMRLDNWMNHFVAEQAAAIIRALGYSSTVIVYPPYPELVIIDTHMAVNIGTGCNGLPMLYLFAAFVIAHPGPLKRKAWFLPLGILIIHGLNMVRVVALGFIAVYYRQWFYINHKYLYVIAVYSLIVALFAWWHFRLADPAKPALPRLSKTR